MIRRHHDIRLFRQVWAHFDPEGKGVLPISMLKHFIHKLAAKVLLFHLDFSLCFVNLMHVHDRVPLPPMIPMSLAVALCFVSESILNHPLLCSVTIFLGMPTVVSL